MSSAKQKNNRVVVHLSLIGNVGPVTVFKLLKHLYLKQYPDVLHAGWMEFIERQDELNLEVLYAYSAVDFIHRTGVTGLTATTLATGLADKHLLDRELEQISKHNIGIVTFLDNEYPEILKQIHTPPLVLYYRGAPFAMSAKRIGIVGARKASDYAVHVMKKIVPGLVEREWHIVSGGAEGVDTIAHRVTLDVGGRTIAILGSGLMVPYPQSNIILFDRMVENGGTVVSPFPLFFPPDRGNFPARNRIISGLSLGCIIVQAAEKSGALITAQCALEQGRQVFAVPGPINEDLSAGCHRLIKEGAKLVNHVNDVLEEFGELAPSVVPQARMGDEVTITQRTVPQETDPILACLSGATASLDELLEKTGLEAVALQDRLFLLQVEGRVRQNFAGTWESI